MSITQKEVSKILNSKEFHQLVKKRRSVSILFTVLMLTVYFGFILLIAFNKPFLSTNIGEHISLGLPLGIGIIVFAWVLTGLYIYWANNKYDKSVRDLKNQISK